MATTKNGIVYPDNYDKVADVPADLKEMAESVDENIEQINEKIKQNSNNIEPLQTGNTTNKKSIEELKQKNAEQDESIETNESEIEELKQENIEIKAENERLRDDIKSIALVGEESGESIDLEDSAEVRFNKFAILGNHKQETRSGKNLFENRYSNVTQNGITLKVNEDGTIILNGTDTSTNAYNDFNLIKMFEQKGTKTASVSVISGSATKLVEWQLTDENWENTLYMGIANNVNSTNAKLKDEIIYTNSTLRIEKGCTCNNLMFGLQIENGTEATSYEEYVASPSPNFSSEIKTVKNNVGIDVVNKENTEKQSITMPVQQEMLDGDYFDFENEKEVHTWKKQFLTGEEEISRYTVTGDIEYRFVISEKNVKKNTSLEKIPNVLCNKLKAVSLNDTYFKKQGITVNDADEALIVYIKECKDMTVNEFKAYIKTQYDNETPFFVYYKLETPIQLEFTEEQKTVAKQIKQTLHTYKNVTHIYSKDEISPKIDIEYAKDLNTVINNIQAQIINNASEEV